MSLSRWFSRRGASAEKAQSDPSTEGDDADYGFRAVRRACDSIFDDAASRIEGEAVELARSAAAANLPRPEVAYEQVEEEAELAARCRSAFHDWIEGVRTTVQDAVQGSMSRAAAGVRTFEHEITMLGHAKSDLRQATAELDVVETVADVEHAHLEVRPLLTKSMYWLLIPILVVVDWVANVPVFTELLPKDQGSEEAWRALVARTENMGIWGGVYRVFARTLHNIDASLLALGVIIFLVWLAHVFGQSMRRMLAHTEEEAPTAAVMIRAHRRQALVPAILSFVGLVAVLGVLWLGRERLETTTASRLADTESRIEDTRGEIAQARAVEDLEEIARLEQELAGLRTLQTQRAERADYAIVIGRMNTPILLLNFVLAISAAMAGYLATSDKLRGVLTNPRAAALVERMEALRAEIARRSDGLGLIATGIARELQRVDYLVATHPLSGWQAKAERLRAVIPRFRSENARARGIDASNVTAFRRPPALEFGPAEEEGVIAPPAELAEYREQFARLHESARGALAHDPNREEGARVAAR